MYFRYPMPDARWDKNDTTAKRHTPAAGSRIEAGESGDGRSAWVVIANGIVADRVAANLLNLTHRVIG